MKSVSLAEDFFSSGLDSALKEPKVVKKIMLLIAPDSAMFYELTFHAAFAKRIFDIIKREGPGTQGFDRMQQSFSESVEKIRGILSSSATNDEDIRDILSSTPEGKARLSRLIEDLTLLKNWLVSEPRPL